MFQSNTESDGTAVPVLGKALAVLAMVSRGEAGGSLAQMARRCGVAPTTLFRVLRTFESADWISQRLDGGWELSAGLAQMLRPLEPFRRLIVAAQEPADELAIQLGLAVKLSVRQGAYAVTLVRAEPPRAVLVGGRLGARYPLAFGSSGAVLAAELDEAALRRLIKESPADVWANQTEQTLVDRVLAARRDGACVDRGSFHPQVHTVSVAVALGGGAVNRAALTVVGLPDELDGPERCRQIEKAARGAARQIERAYQGEESK